MRRYIHNVTLYQALKTLERASDNMSLKKEETPIIEELELGNDEQM